MNDVPVTRSLAPPVSNARAAKTTDTEGLIRRGGEGFLVKPIDHIAPPVSNAREAKTTDTEGLSERRPSNEIPSPSSLERQSGEDDRHGRSD